MLFLKKVFFEKLLNLFQSNHPDLSLKLVKIVIGILGNVVHNFVFIQRNFTGFLDKSSNQ